MKNLLNFTDALEKKNPDGGKDWRQEEKGTAEVEMVGWHHWLDGQEFAQTPEFGDGQGNLACCILWDHKESDITEWLNLTELILIPSPDWLIWPMGNMGTVITCTVPINSWWLITLLLESIDEKSTAIKVV